MWTVQQVRKGEVPPLTELEFVKATLLLANWASEDADQGIQIFYTLGLRPHGFNRWEQRTPREKISAEELRTNRGEKIFTALKTAQPLVREVLLDLLEKPRTARLRHAGKVTEWISKLEFYGIPKFERNTLRYENVVCGPVAVDLTRPIDYLHDAILPMVGWALAVLLDQNRKVGQYLHQCRLKVGDSRCQNLFLAPPTKEGGRPIRYCSDEHIADARRQQAARRAQRYRDRIASRHK